MGRHRDRKYGTVPTAAMMANGMSPYRSPPIGAISALIMLPMMGMSTFVAVLVATFRKKRVPVVAPVVAPPVAVAAVPINTRVTLPVSAGITTTGYSTATPVYSGMAASSFATGACSTGACPTGTCAPVGFNERLVAAERMPGVKVKEIDVVTRRKVKK
jgi:hypothetical protein